jgi:hypothetical protein
MWKCRRCRCLIGRLCTGGTLRCAAARETLTCSGSHSLVRAAYTNREHSRSTISRLTKGTIFLLLRTERVGLGNLVIVNSSLEILFPLQAVCLHVHPTARLHRENHQQSIIICPVRWVVISYRSLRIREAPLLLRCCTENQTLQVAIIFSTRNSYYGYRRRCGDCP